MEMGMRYLEDLFFCSSETKSFRIILISTISIFLNSRLLFLSIDPQIFLVFFRSISVRFLARLSVGVEVACTFFNYESKSARESGRTDNSDVLVLSFKTLIWSATRNTHSGNAPLSLLTASLSNNLFQPFTVNSTRYSIIHTRVFFFITTIKRTVLGLSRKLLHHTRLSPVTRFPRSFKLRLNYCHG